MKQFILGLLALSLSVTTLAEEKPATIEVEFKTGATLYPFMDSDTPVVKGAGDAACWIFNNSGDTIEIKAGEKIEMQAFGGNSEVSWRDYIRRLDISCSGERIVSTYGGRELAEGTFKALQTEMSLNFGFKAK